MLPHSEANKQEIRKAKYQNIDSIYMMEEGKLAKGRPQVISDTKGGIQDFSLQSSAKTTLTHECYSTAKSIDHSKTPQVKANIQKSTENLNEKKLPNDTSMTDSAVSLRVPDADIPRSLMLSAEKGN